MMHRDLERFRQIVKGKIKENLKKYISSEDLITKRGQQIVSVPLPKITLPKIRYGKGSGVGQGKGGPKAGSQAQDHLMEVEVPIEELADLLGEELQLPRIEPKGKQQIIIESSRYRGIRKIGPESLRSFRQTYKEALKRSIIDGGYDPEDPLVVPTKEDKRFKSSRPIFSPQSQALIIYILDISGSMGFQEKTLARIVSFWVDTWLRRNYKNLVSRYIVHDAEAKEVDSESFYHLQEAGGTRIASAYQLAKKILEQEYSIADWNVYLFQFSDGEDWDGDSSGSAVEILRSILPLVNQLSYCQIRAPNGFIDRLTNAFKDNPKVVTAQIEDREQIYGAIKQFFQKGQ